MFERNIVVSFCQTAPPKWAFSQLGCSVIVWLCYPMAYSTLGFPAHHQLLEFAQTHVHRIGDSIQPSHPLCPLLLLPSTFPSIRVSSNKSALCIMWPKYWSFNFSISPSNEYSGLISFRIDLFVLLSVQGTLKCLLQHHNLKASVLQHLAFSVVQLSHLYVLCA